MPSPCDCIIYSFNRNIQGYIDSHGVYTDESGEIDEDG